MGSANEKLTQLQLERGRAQQAGGGDVLGYRGPGSVPREVPGDEESAWIKVPPFTEDVTRWVETRDLPVADYVATPEVEVADARLLIVYFTLVWADPPDDTAQLSIIPEKRVRGQWFTTGVVDPTIAAVDPTGATFGDNFGSRTWYPAELLTPVFTGGPRTVRSSLVFDVSDTEAFRLQLLQNIAAQTQSTLSLDYARSQ